MPVVDKRQNHTKRRIFSSLLTVCMLAGLGLLVYKFVPLSMMTQSIAEQGNPSVAAITASDPKIKQPNAIVVELFTSQGCSSCPTAEAILRELSQQADVLTLEFHVDYWNNLTYAFSGRWKDPFSSPQSTMRQADYNSSLLNSKRIYTPQVIIDGSFEAAGTKKRNITKAITNARNKRNNSLTVTPTVTPRGELTVTLNTEALPGHPHLLFVRFFKRKETLVTAGENKGKTLADYNIVTHWNTLHEWNKKDLVITKQITPLLENESCAILLQDRKSYRIYSAGLCQTI